MKKATYRAIGTKVQMTTDGKRWVNVHYCGSEERAREIAEQHNNGTYRTDYSGVHFFGGINGY